MAELGEPPPADEPVDGGDCAVPEPDFPPPPPGVELEPPVPPPVGRPAAVEPDPRAGGGAGVPPPAASWKLVARAARLAARGLPIEPNARRSWMIGRALIRATRPTAEASPSPRIAGVLARLNGPSWRMKLLIAGAWLCRSDSTGV